MIITIIIPYRFVNRFTKRLRAAEMLGVTRKTLSEFVNEKSALSPEMAIRIAKATTTTPKSWMAMQMKLTLWLAMQNSPKNVKVACFG